MRNFKSVSAQPSPYVTPKLSVPVKEMTMNKLEFGEVIFGGNLKANLKVEANMNRTIIREKYKRSKA